jgi:ubiquinone/menaquinone biosynthesis C-methylase UbiE
VDRRLTEDERRRITNLYEMRYQQFGQSHKTVGWGSVSDQVLRFEMLCRGLSLSGKSIIDVGCGLGDLVPFLMDRYGDDFHYTGIDIAQALVVDAQGKYGQPNVRFICGEILELDENEQYDVALLSGALSYRIADNLGYAGDVLNKLFRMTREVVSVNFLSSYVDYQEEKNFHYSPEDMFGFAKQLTKWVTLYHDYRLWEFTLQIRHAAYKYED